MARGNGYDQCIRDVSAAERGTPERDDGVAGTDHDGTDAESHDEGEQRRPAQHRQHQVPMRRTLLLRRRRDGSCQDR